MFVVERRQAVHKLDVRVACGLHHVRVDLIRLHQADALGPGFLRLAHGDPHVGVEEIGPPHAFFHVVGEGDARARLFRDGAALLNQPGFRPEGFRRDEADIHPHLGRADHQRVAHVVARVAEIGKAQLRQGFARRVLQHGHQVGEDLRGVELVGQAVPHRHARVLAQLLNDGLAVAAILNAVVHAAQHAGGVFHRLFMADLRAAWAEVGDLRTLVERAHFEGAAGAGGGFFKDQSDVFPDQGLLFTSGFFGGLQLDGEVDQVLDLRRGVVQQYQESAVFQIDGHR